MASRKEIWERVTDLCEKAPCDGIRADGEFSEALQDRQKAYRAGLRIGGLAAMNVAVPKKVNE